MDPLTQASLGAAAAALLSRRGTVRLAVVVGALAGAAPDLDVLIRSDSDPLLALHYHRHFTHALIFAPIIGLLVAVLLKAVFFWKAWRFRELALFGVVGALTHGLLDACTSYGTSLYLPFSAHRVSWDLISIIDPIFTLPLFLLTVFAYVWRRPGLAQLAILLCVFYFCFGLYQRERAARFAQSLAESRGHVAMELTVRPSLANTVLWRIIYRHEDRYFVDAVSIVPGHSPRHYAGQSVAVLTPEAVGSSLPPGSRLALDIQRFRIFSQGYLYLYHGEQALVGDLRYAMVPDSIEPLWGLAFDPRQPDANTQFVHLRDRSKRPFVRLWTMIRGQPVATRPVLED